MSKLMQDGPVVYGGNPASATPIVEVPPGNWQLNFNPMTVGFYLERVKEFEVPEKIYGDIESFSDKILNSFKKWDGNLGVLLAGYKGTGKSLLAKRTCIEAVTQGLPVIMISEPYGGADLNGFLGKIDHPFIVFIDEFEKVYREDDGNRQQALLSLLDGSTKSDILFLLTINEMSRMSQYLLDRPGRIHYMKLFEGMDQTMLEEIVKENLQHESRYEDVMRIASYVGEISMDIIHSIVKEVNEYPHETVKELLQHMNISQTTTSYHIKVFLDGQLYAKFYSYDITPYDRVYHLDWNSYDLKKSHNVDTDGLRRLSMPNINKVGEEGYKDWLKSCNSHEADMIVQRRAELHSQDPQAALDPKSDEPDFLSLDVTDLSFKRDEVEIRRDETGCFVMSFSEDMHTHEGVRTVEWAVRFEKKKRPNSYHY